MKTSKYRVWVAVPVEVSALDELGAEREVIERLGEDYLGDSLQPILGSDKRRLAKMQHVLKDVTEVRRGQKWENLLEEKREKEGKS